MAWWRVSSDLLDDRIAQTMPVREFKRQALAAMKGEDVYLSRFIKPDYGRPFANEWAEIRTRIFARDDYTCTYCAVRGVALECDHIVPVARGGGHDDENLTTACRACNRSKRDMLIEEWRPA